MEEELVCRQELFKLSLKFPGFRCGGRDPFVSAKGPKTMLALAWPFGFPVRFADPFGLAQDKSGGDANSLSLNSAPSSFRNRVHSLATPMAKF